MWGFTRQLLCPPKLLAGKEVSVIVEQPACPPKICV